MHVFRAHQLRIIGMRLNVAKTVGVARNVAKGFRLRLVGCHVIRIIGMAGYIAARGRLFGMRRDGADKIVGRHDAERGEFAVSQMRIVGMSGDVAEEHRMTRNGAAWRLQFAAGRIASVETIIRVIRMLWNVALICWMSRCVADRVGTRCQARMTVFWIIRMTHKVAQNLGMTGQIDVAHSVYFGRRTARRVLRIIRVFW